MSQNNTKKNQYSILESAIFIFAMYVERISISGWNGFLDESDSPNNSNNCSVAEICCVIMGTSCTTCASAYPVQKQIVMIK